MVNCKDPVKLTFMNDNHAGPELCRLDQHLDSFLSNSLLVVSSLFRQLQRGSRDPLSAFALLMSGIKTAPEHSPRDALDADHQGGQTHVNLLLLTHIEHLVEGFDKDLPQFFVNLF